MNWGKAIGVFCVAIFALKATLAADAAVVSSGSLEVRFSDDSRTIEISDRELGTILDRGAFHVLGAARGAGSDSRTQDVRVTADDARREIRVEVVGLLIGRIRLVGNDRIEILVEGKRNPDARFSARAVGGADAMVAELRGEKEADRGVLVTTLGPARVPHARSLFIPKIDLAMSIKSETKVDWIPVGERSRREMSDIGWMLSADLPAESKPVTLQLHRNYYRETLGIKHYAPIEKRPKWPTAPVVAMTWYGIKGWQGKPAQTKAWLYPNIDWVAKHLLPYAESLVFQLDDNYYTDNDKYMRDISDYIRSKGLIPGIWFTPYTVAPKEVTKKHPDWFIHDKAGKPIGTFGGVSYGGRSTLNVNNPEAVKNWFGMWWRKASETWNFDFFKIDGQPPVAGAYRKSVDGGGDAGYRKGLEIARGIVGPEKFINGCWGIPLEAIGRVDGSRTGGDTGNQPHAMDVVLRWNFLNNVCWWSDPDAAANLYKATVERTRLNAQARVLTGQQFLTDDVWTSVPPAIERVWQLSYPMLDIRPVNLYKIDDWKRYDLFDLRIAKPWGTYDVVGLFNYDGRPVEKKLDLSRLPLEADGVHVFEFWSSTYLGTFSSDTTIVRALAPYEGEAFAITPAVEDQPVLISTSRHASQGGLDLERLTWTQKGRRWIATGKSSHLVAGDPYELVFAPERYRITQAESSIGEVHADSSGGVARVRMTPRRGASADWSIAFERRTEPYLDVVPTACELRSGMKGEITISNRGPVGFTWEAEASHSRIHISPSEGQLAAWPRIAKMTVSVDAAGLDWGSTWKGSVVLRAKGVEGSPKQVAVEFRVPPPENLALRAKARGSSQWNLNYKADRANDGVYSTRWNPREGDKNGCWIELVWEKPVEFDRVVIDECMDFGPRIQAWRLEAGDGKRAEIARGKGAGQKHTVDLSKPVEAKRLRLTIDKASVVPTIWELEVYRMKKPK